MTALTEYERLESPGLWRASSLDQRREVIVSLRNTSLVLSDPKTEMAIVHWSLPAMVREGAGKSPALFKPGLDATETLEVDDDTMILSLDKVIKGLHRRKAHPGRLRGFILGTVLVGLVGGCVLWLPGALARQTATILPEPNRAELGQMALEDLERLTGSPCDGGLGQRAASALSERLLGKGYGRIMVVRDGLHGAIALPGGLVVISRDLVEAPPDAETAAGFVVASLAARGSEDAQAALFLRHAGMIATLRLLTTGTLPEGSMSGIGEVLLAQAARIGELEADTLLPRFVDAQLSPGAFAAAVSGSGSLSQALVAKDPFAGASPRPALDDSNWISLQSICFD